MPFDVEGARKAGYTDAEIANYLAGQHKFDAKEAKKAGYSDSELIAYLSGKTDLASQIPVEPGANTTTTPEPETTLADKAIGAGEAALSTVTGLTGGAAGMVAGTVGGLAGAVLDGQFGTPEGAQRVEQAAAQGAQALTYQPRTPSGQAQAEAVGQALQQTIPAVPVMGGIPVTTRPAMQAARPAVQSMQQAKAAALQAVKEKVLAAAERRQAANDPNARPTPGTMGSVGAAGTDVATMRRADAQQLPVPVELTKGQAERTFEQQRFEQEMAKDPTKGQALRDRAADQHAAIWKNFDAFLDETGAQKTQLGEVGDTVKGALMERATADKNRVRSAYKEAEKAGELEPPVTLQGAVEYLNDNAPDAAVAKVLDAARARAIRLGVAAEGANGELVANPVPLKTAELFRRAVSNATGFEPTNIRHSAQIKGLVDQATDGMGGDLYRQARGLRARYAQNYENIGLIYDLMNNKRGMADMRVAAEDVFRRSILNSSMADVKQLRRILQTGGDNGKQAWRELQGATLRHIREEAARNITRNERGQEMVSAKGLDSAITGLDKSGKLDFIFGKKGAEQLRSLNDLAKVLFTAPPGAINTSNTASVILAALDMATSGVAGMPLPVMSGLRILTTHVRDRQIQKRINEALGIKPEPKKVKAPVSIVPANPTTPHRVPESRTVH